MSQLLQIFILLPLAGFFVSLLVPRKKERIISRLALGTLTLHFLGCTAFIVLWLFQGSPTLDIKHITFFKQADIEIFVDFYFDRVTAVFAFMGSCITLLVAVFSKYYMHRDEGFKRFFSTILLFFLGFNLLVFSGNFETLFMGWEVIGICSFLLIAFYRDRYLPVKNALKVISIYRLGDIFLILAMWMSHQLWHQNITFDMLNDAAVVEEHLTSYPDYGVFIALCVLIAAATKSAQLPFLSWLPRAMEGPTVSSAVFYGSLSVHLGAFLLLRTYPYWESIFFFKVLVIAIGLGTSFIASHIARVQSTVKTQIAYSSISQIGLILIEVALGFHVLALIHFAGNAFLRTYQLLVSPSVLSYLNHDMVFNFKAARQSDSKSFFNRVKNSFYIWSIKEWNLDSMLHRYLWSPFKRLGNAFAFFQSKAAIVLLSLIFLFGVYCNFFPATIPSIIYSYLPVVFSFASLILILNAFTERKDARRAWTCIFSAQLFMTLSIALYHEGFGLEHILIFLSGALICYVTGYFCLQRIEVLDREVDLDRFHGHVYEHPVLAFIFLVACLGLVGFPFTPTFIGIDLLFSHVHKQEILLIIFIALSFIFMELAVLRMYARIFMGQHKKPYHPIAFRSS
jgi:NADH-quinone oxidoreductase subunit L